MAKRKTLPNEFEQLVKEGKEEEIKALYEKCDINAYGGYVKGNAFFFPISEDLMKWLLEQGADINYVDTYGDTPLSYHAGHAYSVTTAINLVKFGADVTYTSKLYHQNALHHAIPTGSVELVQCLLEAGADIKQADWHQDTPLEAAFHQARTFDLIKLEPVTKFLISYGIKVTPKVQQYMETIAKDTEFRRKSLNVEFVDELDAAMKSLYELLDVTPVPRRVEFDVNSEIVIREDRWQKQYNELWNLLVPGSGHANTVQGEVIRLSGRISYELLDNGGINWDKDFAKMAKALKEYLHQGNPLSEEEYNELNHFFATIKDAEEKEFNREAELAVKWVSLNSKPILLDKIGYIR